MHRVSEPWVCGLRNGLPLLEAMSRIGCGGLILTPDGKIHAINALARAILQAELGLSDREAAALPDQGREALREVLARSRTRFRLEEDSWVVIARAERRPLVLHALRIPNAEGTYAHTAVILIDLAKVLQPNQTALEQVFGLTPAESRLVLLLVGGATPMEAAQAQGTSVATVRSQLGAIYSKTCTRRQAELVSLAARLTIVP